MLQCNFSVIDHRWRQNGVKTKKWHMSHNWACLFIPHFDIFCDLLLIKPMATWNLFCFIQWQKRKKRHTRNTAWLFEDFCEFRCQFRHILSHKHYFSTLLRFFFSSLNLTCTGIKEIKKTRKWLTYFLPYHTNNYPWL